MFVRERRILEKCGEVLEHRETLLDRRLGELAERELARIVLERRHRLVERRDVEDELRISELAVERIQGGALRRKTNLHKRLQLRMNLRLRCWLVVRPRLLVRRARRRRSRLGLLVVFFVRALEVRVLACAGSSARLGWKSRKEEQTDRRRTSAVRPSKLGLVLEL